MMTQLRKVDELAHNTRWREDTNVRPIVIASGHGVQRVVDHAVELQKLHVLRLSLKLHLTADVS